MIISASYKTDIPTFYGEWFIRRLRAGYCRTINPYGRQIYRVPLDRKFVDGFVFWTKNIGPFLKHLVEVQGRGFPFVVQHTVNRYPRALETSVVDASRSIEAARSVSERFGRAALVWRYDTIVTSTLTPVDWHVENFRGIAAQLEGATDEVVVSFAQIYRKTERNMNLAAERLGFGWSDPDPEGKRNLVRQLLHVARGFNMKLSICSQRDLLVEGAEDARCVDARRLQAILGTTLGAKLKGNRKDCGCYESRDIGDYDTCPHGCVYCYAVQNQELARSRFRVHNPDSDFLFDPPGEPPGATDRPLTGPTQLRLLKE